MLATVIGEVTEGDRLTVDWHGERIVDVPPRTVAHEGPVYERPMAAPARPRRPAGRRRRARCRGRRTPAPSSRRTGSPCSAARTAPTRPGSPSSTTATCAATPCSPSPRTPASSASTRSSHRGIALALDGNARFARLDPYTGAQLNLAEAYRNVAVTGATPLAVTNCLNFGSPEEPEVMWQFAEAVRGLADGCRELGLPVTGGNVSLYNQTGDVAINPTPVIGVLGVHEDVRTRVPCGWRADGRDGAAARRDAARVRRLRLGERRARPPRRAARRRSTWPPSGALGELLAALGRDGLVSSAHDLADGGLAQALAESALRYGVGARLRLDGDAFTALFSESAARAVVTTSDPAAVRAAAERGRRPGHRAGDDGRRRPRRRRPARAARSPSCGPPGRPRCRRCSARPRPAVGTVPAGTVPTS